MQEILVMLFSLAFASADDEQMQIAQPNFAIYHTKCVSIPHDSECQRVRVYFLTHVVILPL